MKHGDTEDCELREVRELSDDKVHEMKRVTAGG